MTIVILKNNANNKSNGCDRYHKYNINNLESHRRNLIDLLVCRYLVASLFIRIHPTPDKHCCISDLSLHSIP